jgi:5S rRNA maturation endonuclease (ribonuclease M5)
MLAWVQGGVMAATLPHCPDAYALAEAIAQLCEDAHPYKDEWRARCPNHQGKSATSFSLSPANDRVLIHCHGACSPQDVVHALGLTMADLFLTPSLTPSTNGHKRIVKVYAYVDIDGDLVHETVRYDPKDFRQRRPDPAKPGEYIWNLQGIEPVLYHLPQVLAAVQRGEPIYIVEGEKDADSLQALGLTATCNPMGTGKWRTSYSEALRGAHVVILPDHDDPGLRHAERVARALDGIAADIKVVFGLHTHIPGSDISDWLNVGGTRAGLEAAVARVPWYPVPPVAASETAPIDEPTSETINTAPMPLLDISPPWPQLAEEAYYGLAGEIVRTIEPHTESDPVALLVQLLAMAGNVIGRTPYFPVEADRHHMNLFVCLVGQSSKGRKGTSAGHPRRLLTTFDCSWSQRVMGGLSSGEGVIWNLRDPVYGHNKKGEEVCLDEGVEDKRLCILETEFARALAKTGQEGNVLSAVLRQAWDHGDLRTLVSGRQKAPVAATNAHVSVIAHITVEEVRRLLTETEAANGFGNRFLWVCVRRSKLLPRGGLYPEQALKPLLEILAPMLFHARAIAQMQRTTDAETRWEEMYATLAEGQAGLLGALTARAEAQVLRLSCLYALLDKTEMVDVPHLEAAYALWLYCEASAQYIFGTLLGDPLADEIYRMLRQMGSEGMTRTDINNTLGRNYKSAVLGRALDRLLREGHARCIVEKTAGRPIERWFASTPVSARTNELNEKSPPATTLNSFNSLLRHAENETAGMCHHPQMGQKNGQQVCLDCGELLETAAPTPAFDEFTASVLWCNVCRQAQPVRPQGETYHCTGCGAEVGTKTTTAPTVSMHASSDTGAFSADDDEVIEWTG